MAKDKTLKAANGAKHSAKVAPSDERPAKKAKLLDDSDSEAENDVGGVKLKVNEEYARRFEHNKKRAEMHRLEEKYGQNPNDEDSEETDSEDDEDEDDVAELITENLDAEISATLQAIRAKDPRVYDPKVKFYREEDEQESDADNASGSKKEKPMTLRDYHTKNLLEGKLDPGEEEDDAPPRTYVQEQEEVRQNLVKEIYTTAEDDDEEDFLVAKSKPAKRERVTITEQDVVQADKDPETFLSNFMSSRAWVPTDKTPFQGLESEDEEELARAEEFEAAYNLYFEDPSAANEKLMTYARDAIANTSVRREEPNARKKAREVARAKREAERREREQEIARLRKLKIEEMEEKAQHIRKAAGLTGRDFKVEEWADVLEADWSDERWDEEMRKRFGDNYYEQGEGYADSDDEEEDGSKKNKKKKPKKPKWDDDIDIHDLVPDFEDDDPSNLPFSLSDEEDGGVEVDEEDADEDEDEDEQTTGKGKTPKQKKQERAEAKSAARRDRRLIENLVDQSLEYDLALASKTKGSGGFRYRETSPVTFGLTARDILLADDAKLNEFAGLKKLATFRDPAKKKKEKKALSKKARLRAWRKDTFGDEEGPKGGFEILLGDETMVVPMPKESSRKDKNKEAVEDGVDIREGEKKKKKRSKKRKLPVVEE